MPPHPFSRPLLALEPISLRTDVHFGHDPQRADGPFSILARSRLRLWGWILGREQSPSYHVEVGQRCCDLKSMQIFRQAAVADLLEAKHPLDHPDRVLDFGAHPRLGLVRTATRGLRRSKDASDVSEIRDVAIQPRWMQREFNLLVYRCEAVLEGNRESLLQVPQESEGCRGTEQSHERARS